MMLSFANLSVRRNMLTVPITVDTANYDNFIGAGSPPFPLELTTRITSSGSLFSTNILIPALTVANTFPSGSELFLVNEGLVQGKGGAGGRSADASCNVTVSGAINPEPGGSAITLNSDLIIINIGTIGGGGGGGGQGSTIVYTDGSEKANATGGGGGAGASKQGSAPGVAGTSNTGHSSGTCVQGQGTNGSTSLSLSGAGGGAGGRTLGGNSPGGGSAAPGSQGLNAVDGVFTAPLPANASAGGGGGGGGAGAEGGLGGLGAGGGLTSNLGTSRGVGGAGGAAVIKNSNTLTFRRFGTVYGSFT